MMSAICPVYPKQQTFPGPVGTSHLCQLQTTARGYRYRRLTTFQFSALSPPTHNQILLATILEP
jgi:hypothetical protein